MVTLFGHSDIDKFIFVLRKYAGKRHPIPAGLMADLAAITSTDLRLRLYFWDRLLHYPALRRAITESLSDDDEGDEGKGTTPDKLQVRTEMLLPPEPSTHAELMFQ